MLVCHRHDSDALKNNPLKDPTLRDLWVYLPPDYHASDALYPVLYFLPAYGASASMMVGGNGWSPSLHERIDGLIAQGMPPIVGVLVDGFTRLGGSQFLNSPATGPYMDYVADELVSFVDATYRTKNAREHRAVVGRSSGGYGAFRLATDRPDVFAAFACQSGDMGFELGYGPDFANAAATLQQAGSIGAFEERFLAKEKKRGSDFMTMSMLAMAAAYSPNPDGTYELPFDIETGARRPEIWKRWLQQDPVERAALPSVVEALRNMKLSFFDCGTRDEHYLHLGLRRLSKKLKEQNVAHTLEEFDDGHRSLSYRLSTSIPALARAIGDT